MIIYNFPYVDKLRGFEYTCVTKMLIYAVVIFQAVNKALITPEAQSNIK